MRSMEANVSNEGLVCKTKQLLQLPYWKKTIEPAALTSVFRERQSRCDKRGMNSFCWQTTLGFLEERASKKQDTRPNAYYRLVGNTHASTASTRPLDAFKDQKPANTQRVTDCIAAKLALEIKHQHKERECDGNCPAVVAADGASGALHKKCSAYHKE
jgi:hypothetical protein